MKCPECDILLPNGSKFCKQCGRKLELNCPECGNSLPPDSNFCFQCGHDLRKPKEPPAIDYNAPQSYTPKFLADKILTSRSALEGERKLVTVLFADVAGFTAMSEKLDPEDVHEIMDGCFRILMDEIHRYEGTINQFTGDGVMALFGAPLAHEDHAQRACHASLAIQKALIPYSAKLHNEYGVDFTMRIGLNSGPVVVGGIGDDLRMDYTALGDTANLAARMESNAEPGSVLASKHTYWVTRDFFQFELLGPLTVKGKGEPVKAYRLLKVGDVGTRIEAAAGRGFTRFVGRKRELESLSEAFEQVKSGRGQVVGIVGEAGVGKSRILHEFRNYLPQGEYTYLEWRCLHYGGSMPYLPILAGFRSFAGIKEGDAEKVIKSKIEEKIVRLDEDLRRIIPPFQDLLSLKVDDEEYVNLEPAQKKERIFEAVRDLLVSGSQNVPMVLAIEDLHWIDKTTEELLAYLIEWIPSTSIFLVLLHRPEYVHHWGSKSYYTKVGVDQLPSMASAELVQAILEGGEVEPELKELILSRASGNPFFMEELTYSLVENGSIERRDARYVLSASLSDIQIPDTVQGIIASRMDRLDETLKRLLQVASVIGREFFFRILQSITGMREELKSHLLNLQGLEFIYEKRLFPELEYIFKHALIQEVAYNSLLMKRRREIHEKIGQAMEEIFQGRLEEFYEMLAYHYSKSDHKAKAYEYMKLSGEKATRKNSLSEAFSSYREAAETMNSLPGTEENKRKLIEVVLLMAPVMRLLGYPEGSLGILEQGEKLSKELGDVRSAASLLSSGGLCHSSTGSHEKGREYQENAFRAAERTGDVELIAPIGFDLFAMYFMKAEWANVAHTSSKLCTVLERSGRRFDIFGRVGVPYACMTAGCGQALGALGNFSEGKPLIEKALICALETNHSFTIGIVELHCSLFFRFMGDAENTLKHAENGIRHMEQSQSVIWIDQAWTAAGYAHYLLGNMETALLHMEKSLRIKSAIPLQFWMSQTHCLLSMVHLDLGESARALHHAEKAVRLSEQSYEGSWEGLSRIAVGRILGKMGMSQLGEAEESILHGIRILEEKKMQPDTATGYLRLGEFYADHGREDEARKNITTAKLLFQEMGMDYWLAKAQEALAMLR